MDCFAIARNDDEGDGISFCEIPSSRTKWSDPRRLFWVVRLPGLLRYARKDGWVGFVRDISCWL